MTCKWTQKALGLHDVKSMLFFTKDLERVDQETMRGYLLEPVSGLP